VTDPIQSGRCAIIYFIDPPHLISPAIPLLLSIRRHHPDATVIPYTPKDRLRDIPERVRAFHERMGAPIRELTQELAFSRKRYDKPYLHGNKLLAAAEERDTEFAIFLDTDTYLARPMDAEALLSPDHVAVVPESVAGFARRFIEIWDATYAIFGLTTPVERVRMLRTDREHPPYFNAGMVAFPEVAPSGRRFGALWLDTAMTIDFDPSVDDEAKRPWLDQASLPVAIARSGARFRELDRAHNYPVDGTDFPPRDDVRLYHYHGMERLEEAGHTAEIEELLVGSGLFRSLEHFLEPLRRKREEAAVYWKQIGDEAEARRVIKKQMEGVERSGLGALKRQIQQSKAREVALRQTCAEIVEEVFYDDGWLQAADTRTMKAAGRG